MLQGSYWKTWKTWKIGHFYKKSGKTGNSQGTFYNFYYREKSGKTQYLVSISFSLTIGGHDIGMELLAWLSAKSWV